MSSSETQDISTDNGKKEVYSNHSLMVFVPHRSILCIFITKIFEYRHKPASFKEANIMIDRYILFYNNERIQLKTGVAQRKLRHSA